MRIGIVGGGINGLCCAWVCAQAGHEVHLWERGSLAGATSSASSKLLHGGLRYLEQYEFRLVRESIKERDAWIKRAPNLARPIRLVMPVYKNSRRGRWLIGAGLFLYDNLAGKSALPPACWVSVKDLSQRDPKLLTVDLIGGYEFSDAQMDDYRLALWVADQAMRAGANLHEKTEVTTLSTNGTICIGNDFVSCDRIINIAGPWASQLLEKSSIASVYKLDTVRGSHLLIDRECSQPLLLEVPNERRIFFVLPWQDKTLVGTTEVRQSLAEPIECSAQEQEYMLRAYNHYFNPHVDASAILNNFTGLRPLLYSAQDPGRSTREYAIERNDKLVSVFGGKWTTALALARKVAGKLN